MSDSSIWPIGAAAACAAVANAEVERQILESATPRTPETQIDRFIFSRLAAAHVPAASPCSDPVFLRRAFLDVIGTLPTPQEARAFLEDENPHKRVELIDRLLDRDEFADYWSLKWADLLRVKSEFPINLWPNAVQAYHRWIRTSIRDNTPYDRFAFALLTASGSCFRVPEVNFYRAIQGRDPESIARAVALTFLGARVEKWPHAQRAAWAAFFTGLSYKATGEWKEEIVLFDPDRAKAAAAGAATQPAFPDGASPSIVVGEDPRPVLARWLTSPKNPWFARCLVNRAWSWFLGRGIVHEPDDFRTDNPPSHPELLRHLEQQFIAGRYDVKKLFRLILTSRTYQLSSLPASADPRAPALFAHYPIRRLEGEVLIDALCQVTDTTEKYMSVIPEPFTIMPEGSRAIALGDGSISSPFLELFGRSPRDTGLESERGTRMTPNQRLHLLNSSHIQKKLERAPFLQGPRRGGRPRDRIDEIYLTLLSRLPSTQELIRIRDHAGTTGPPGREVLVDVAWALINSAEFLYRH